MIKIKHLGLREAYEGYYEEDEDVRAEYEAAHSKSETRQDFTQWLQGWIARRCLQDHPRRRLAIYCEWNGLLGYSSTLYDIATGAEDVV